jgi:hypothetical protein
VLPGRRARRWRRGRATTFLLVLFIVATTLGYCLNRTDRPRGLTADPVVATRSVVSR